MPMTLRGAIMGLFPCAAEVFTRLRGPYKKASELGSILRYALWCHDNPERIYKPRRKLKIERPPVNVPDHIKLWVDALAGMSQAHTKDEYDAADFKSDDLFGPILTAPVKQIRDFYSGLVEAMKADKRIPWVVLAGFEAWGETIIKNAEDGGVKRLKNKLAGEIAELCEGPVAEQLPEAIKRALRWRDPETLEQVKTQLKAGHKPKLKGRESCLFLEVGRGKKKTSVML